MGGFVPRQNVELDRNGQTISGYRQLPPQGCGPGLIVIQEWWGLDEHVASLVDRFAAEGFVALAPDLYGGRVTHSSDEGEAMLQALPVEHSAEQLPSRRRSRPAGPDPHRGAGGGRALLLPAGHAPESTALARSRTIEFLHSRLG